MANIPLDSEAVAKRLTNENGLSSKEGVEIIEILKQHRNIIQSANQYYGKTIESLRSVNNVTRDSIEAIEKYSFYLDQRLLWIPSAHVIKFSEIGIEAKSLFHLV